MNLTLVLALAICAVRRESTAAAVEGGRCRHPSETRRQLTRGDNGFKSATPPPVSYGAGEKKKVSKKTGAVVIGVIAGAIAAVFLFILCAGCFMFHDQWKKENPRSESSPLLPEPE